MKSSPPILRRSVTTTLSRPKIALVFSDMQGVSADALPENVGHLARRPQRRLSGGAIMVRHVGERFERHRREPIAVQDQRRDVRRARKRRSGRRAIAAHDVERQVRSQMLVNDRRSGIERLLHLGDGRENLVPDVKRVGGVERDVARFGDDRRDDVADMTDLMLREGRTQRRVHRPPVAERDGVAEHHFAMPCLGPIGRRHYPQDAGHGSGGVSGNSDDARMRMRTANKHQRKQVRKIHVVDVMALTGDELDILTPFERLSYIHGDHHAVRCIWRR